MCFLLLSFSLPTPSSPPPSILTKENRQTTTNICRTSFSLYLSLASSAIFFPHWVTQVSWIPPKPFSVWALYWHWQINQAWVWPCKLLLLWPACVRKLLGPLHPIPTPRKRASTRNEERVNGLGVKDPGSWVRKTGWPQVGYVTFLRFRRHIIKWEW